LSFSSLYFTTFIDEESITFDLKSHNYSLMKPIFIIAGEKGSGKTTFLLHLLAMLQKKEFKIGGFVALHNFEDDSYSIKNIATNEEIPLMQREVPLEQEFSSFEFSPEGVTAGSNWINELHIHLIDVVAIDEIGRFELMGDLWHNGFTQLVKSQTPLIFTTKTKYVEQILKKWNIIPALVFDVSDFEHTQEAFDQMMGFL